MGNFGSWLAFSGESIFSKMIKLVNISYSSRKGPCLSTSPLILSCCSLWYMLFWLVWVITIILICISLMISDSEQCYWVFKAVFSVWENKNFSESYAEKKGVAGEHTFLLRLVVEYKNIQRWEWPIEATVWGGDIFAPHYLYPDCCFHLESPLIWPHILVLRGVQMQ